MMKRKNGKLRKELGRRIIQKFANLRNREIKSGKEKTTFYESTKLTTLPNTYRYSKE